MERNSRNGLSIDVFTMPGSVPEGACSLPWIVDDVECILQEADSPPDMNVRPGRSSQGADRIAHRHWEYFLTRCGFSRACQRGNGLIPRTGG